MVWNKDLKEKSVYLYLVIILKEMRYKSSERWKTANKVNLRGIYWLFDGWGFFLF